MLTPVTPIATAHLFPPLSAALLALLKALPPGDWDKATACAGWTVHDVVAHLLGGTLGRLTFGRDRQTAVRVHTAALSYAELVTFIDRQNATWVSASRRISPPLLIELLELTEPQLHAYFMALPPEASHGPAVAWAGDADSPNWFDIAREYTEKWLHQQHIREAVGRPLLVERRWLYPVLDTFVRALPHAYRDVAAAGGDLLAFEIGGEAGGVWALQRQAGAWHLLAGTPSAAVATLRLDQEVAWRLWTKGIAPAEARAQIETVGDAALAEPLLAMVAIMG